MKIQVTEVRMKGKKGRRFTCLTHEAKGDDNVRVNV